MWVELGLGVLCMGFVCKGRVGLHGPLILELDNDNHAAGPATRMAGGDVIGPIFDGKFSYGLIYIRGASAPQTT